MDHISDLPDEIFARILNLVPIKQVIRCSIVSKRWDAACRYIIRTRESLSIGYADWYPLRDGLTEELNWVWKRPSHEMDSIMLRSNRLISAMMFRVWSAMSWTSSLAAHFLHSQI